MHVDVTLFTDPACPFAFSAEPVRQRLRWTFGDGLRWTTRMIAVTRDPGEAEKLAGGAPRLQRLHGMPIDPSPYPRPASSEPACRAVVAVRERDPDAADRLLRRLRVRVMAGGLLDDPELIAAAAEDAGVADWSGGEAALEEDSRSARAPSPAALMMDHKLSGPPERRRYSAPSYVIAGVDVPGFRDFDAYDTVLANVAPHLPRRAAPRTVSQVLAWAEEPLATAEVGAIMGGDAQLVRAELARTARFEPVGADGYWTPA